MIAALCCCLLARLPPRVKLPSCQVCPPLPFQSGELHLLLASACWRSFLQWKPRRPGTGRWLAQEAMCELRRHCPPIRPNWSSGVFLHLTPPVLKFRLLRSWQLRLGACSGLLWRRAKPFAVALQFSPQLIFLLLPSSALRLPFSSLPTRLQNAALMQ